MVSMDAHNWVVTITDFGAVGDGESVNTASIQQAIDACAQTGGRVVVPPGVFVTGTLYLKDNIELHIMQGAVLRGSSNLADYNTDDAFPQNQVFKQENVTGAHLIIGHEVRNVSITGDGVIDGNNTAFFEPVPGGAEPWRYWEKRRVVRIKAQRPGQMIYFCECENVAVRDVRLVNAPYWTLFVHGCRNVQIRGLTIENAAETPNTDGIDVDCSQNVTISDCVINTGDDCITLRGNAAPLSDPQKACENFVVSNCVLSTPRNAIRVGVGDGVIRNSTFSNLVITQTRTGINVVSRYSERQKRGATIQNIKFSGLVMECVAPFYISSGVESVSEVSDITFSDIKARAMRSSFVAGSSLTRVRNIRFREVDLEMSGGEGQINFNELDSETYKPYHPGSPSAFYCARAQNIRFQGVHIHWGKRTGAWRHALIVRDCEDLTIVDCDMRDPFPGIEGRSAVSHG